MSDAEHATWAYAHLAWLSQQKRQALARDRFLVLAGASACEAGWPEIAQLCHGLLSRFAPHHLICEFRSMSEALETEAGQRVLQATKRHCPYELAEHLLQRLGYSFQPSDSALSTRKAVQQLLTRPEWHDDAAGHV